MIAPGPQAEAQRSRASASESMPIGEEISRLTQLGRDWLHVKRDQAVARVHTAALTGMTLVLAAFIGAAALATASALLLVGVAQVIEVAGLPTGTGKILIGGGVLG